MTLSQGRVSRLKLRRARELRQELTFAEHRAWNLLRDRRMLGLKFRRQHVIAGFIVDFYCSELRLVLELDGPAHGGVAQSAYDSARTARLEARGLRVIRIANRDVSEDQLGRLLQNLTRRPPSPHGGEGVRG